VYQIVPNGRRETLARAQRRVNESKPSWLMANGEFGHMHVYIEDIGKHEGEEVTIKGGCTTASAARSTS
jgi:hypothetical protein